MTLELRLLYQGTVLPLLELHSQMGAIKNRSTASVSAKQEVERAGPALAEARVSLLYTKEGTEARGAAAEGQAAGEEGAGAAEGDEEGTCGFA